MAVKISKQDICARVAVKVGANQFLNKQFGFLNIY